MNENLRRRPEEDKGRARSSAISNNSLNLDNLPMTPVPENLPRSLSPNNYMRAYEPGSINHELLLFKGLFFPGLTDSQIADRASEAGILRRDLNLKEGDIELLFGKPEEEINDIIQENTINNFYPNARRFINGLRNYIVFGDDFLDHNDFQYKFICNVNSANSCFMLAVSKDYIPEESAKNYLIIDYISKYPFMKRAIHLVKNEELIRDPFFKKLLSLGVLEASPSMKLFMEGKRTNNIRKPKTYQSMRLAAKGVSTIKGGKRGTKKNRNRRRLNRNRSRRTVGSS